MNRALRIQKMKDGCGLVLPEEVLHTLGAKAGDTLYVVDTPDGVELVPYDPDIEKVLESTRDYMRRHRNALLELAK